MSKFNTGAVIKSRQARATTPVKVKTTAPTLRTYNGAPGWERKPKGELFMLAITNMVGEGTFYEGKSERDQRFRALVRKVAEKDPAWVARFIPWLRNEANMRTASVVAAVEYAQVVKGATGDTSVRKVVASALVRPDEPGEALAYAQAMGYSLSGGFQRGVSDAAIRLFNERSLLKYDTDSHGFRFGDVIELVHPNVESEWQNDLFRYAISRRHNRDGLEVPESLATLRKNKELASLPVADRRALLVSSGASINDTLREAGMTWESLSGWLQGPMDAAAWEAIIPSMGYMALLRNLRNFDQAKVSDAAAQAVAAKLADPEQVAKSRQLPMRFLSAYNAAPSLRWSWPLEQALQLSLKNVPVLRGRTLVLIDTSGSMNDSFSRDGSLKRWDAAAMFGLALAIRAESADVVSYSNHWSQFPLQTGGSLLKQLEAFRKGYFFNGGTATAQAARANYKQHDRVVILTDEQANGGYGGNVNDSVPANVPLWNFNLAGYRAGSTPSGADNRHSIGGLTDHGFKMIELVERGQSGEWPF